jgi:multidrug efflux pump subunit AcrB
VVDAFLSSNFSLLLILLCVGMGAVALTATPREEDPQIVVPFIDVFVEAPGASALETQTLAAEPLERLFREIPGVEHVYSMTRPGTTLVTVRFEVGEDREKALVNVYNKLQSNLDRVPPQVARWLVRPVEIDDVPILTLALYAESDEHGAELVRCADELAARLQTVEDVARVEVVGGQRRAARVLIDPLRLEARGLSALEVLAAIGGASSSVRAGELSLPEQQLALEVGPFLSSVEDLGAIVLTVRGGRPVFLRDVAELVDGQPDPDNYTRLALGPATTTVERGSVTSGADVDGRFRPAVTLSLAKRKGANAVLVAERALERFSELQRELLPAHVRWLVTRNYGETADEKVNELVGHLLIAVGTIVVLIGASLGWRAAFIVALAVPLTLAGTLFADLVVGYTINRVTLFALILALGLLVDDPIVDVENIHRHLALGQRPPREATLFAVDEVRPPVILATLAVIVSFLPLFFVSGMMGPYMRPMPFNVPVAMLLSLVVAFTITPWAAYHLLRRDAGRGHAEHEGALIRAYRRVAGWFMASRARGGALLGGVALAFVGSIALALLGHVPLKMLPFDNKSEFQVVVDAPEGTTLEQTARAVEALGREALRLEETLDVTTFTGVASPHDFNGLVRHYFLRRGACVGDVRVNLTGRQERARQAHEIALAVRPALERVAREHGVRISIVEPPPGPPVLAGVVAEVYAPLDADAAQLALVTREVERRFRAIDCLRDVDTYLESERPLVRLQVDREKAAMRGVGTAQVVQTAQMALSGASAGVLHVDGERSPLLVRVEAPRELRASEDDILRLQVPSASGGRVHLGELVTRTEALEEGVLLRKDSRPVQYVVGEAVGRSPVEAVLALQASLRSDPLPAGFEVDLAGEGEWQVTVDVFRDLGLAFAAALAGIYVLLVGQTRSFGLSALIMLSIPLTMIGVFPGFWLLNAVAAGSVGEFENPIYFTATGMIGIIALAGIVVRNSIILIDFIEQNVARGEPVVQACIDAGAVRLRPIVLTAGAAVMGAWVIVFDPIFSGLAWSFVFGILASTAFTLLVVPLAYAWTRAPRGA